MKVWELIAELSKAPAGDDVYVSRGEETYIVMAKGVDRDTHEDAVWVFGDSSETDDPKNTPH